jgi:trk system potassium uptake protein TrkH
VTTSVLLIAAVAAVPLQIDLPGLSFTRAYFEAMSGLSTTGATVLTGLDQLPHSINLWRHALSWLGGMGIIVLAVAILPLLGVGGMQLYRAGAPGTVKDAKLAPRITETARTLWVVYAGMTAACVLALWAPACRCSMPSATPSRPCRSAASRPTTPALASSIHR